jgi:hypothetical protein
LTGLEHGKPQSLHSATGIPGKACRVPWARFAECYC